MRGPQTTDLRRSIACGYTAFLGCRIFVAADQRSSFAQLRKFYDVRERRATFGSPRTRLLSNPGLAGSESQSQLAKETLVLVGFPQRHSETRGECRAARGLAAKSAHRPETRPRFRCACWLHRPTDERRGAQRTARSERGGPGSCVLTPSRFSRCRHECGNRESTSAV